MNEVRHLKHFFLRAQESGVIMGLLLSSKDDKNSRRRISHDPRGRLISLSRFVEQKMEILYQLVACVNRGALSLGSG